MHGSVADVTGDFGSVLLLFVGDAERERSVVEKLVFQSCRSRYSQVLSDSLNSFSRSLHSLDGFVGGFSREVRAAKGQESAEEKASRRGSSD